MFEFAARRERSLILAKRKRNLWDELLALGRRVVKEVDGLFDKRGRQSMKPARAPVPVRGKGKIRRRG